MTYRMDLMAMGAYPAQGACNIMMKTQTLLE
jgi:hypothetical protein